jgi:hypothetical protein
MVNMPARTQLIMNTHRALDSFDHWRPVTATSEYEDDLSGTASQIEMRQCKPRSCRSSIERRIANCATVSSTLNDINASAGLLTSSQHEHHVTLMVLMLRCSPSQPQSRQAFILVCNRVLCPCLLHFPGAALVFHQATCVCAWHQQMSGELPCAHNLHLCALLVRHRSVSEHLEERERLVLAPPLGTRAWQRRHTAWTML